VVEEVASPSSQIYQKVDTGKPASDYIAYASKISNNDLDFILTLNAENGQWTPDRIGSTGDIGFCQISPYWHPEIVSDPNFYNPYWQLDKCLSMYQGGVTFYGYNVRLKNKDQFYLTTY